MKIKYFLSSFVFILFLAMASFAQLIVRNSADNPVMRVTQNGRISLGLNNTTETGTVNIITSSGVNAVYFSGSNPADITHSAGELGFRAASGYGLKFYANNNTTPNMFITAGGNIGIGTTSPMGKMHSYQSDNNAKNIYATGGSRNYLEKVLIIGDNPDAAVANPEFYYLWLQRNGHIALGLKNTSDGTEGDLSVANNAFRFYSNENYLTFMDVDNNATSARFEIGSNNYSAEEPAYVWRARFTEAKKSDNITESVLFELRSGFYVDKDGIAHNASSRAYKDNIVNLDEEEALKIAMALRPVKFNFKGNDKPQIGFIAEEMPQPLATEDQKTITWPGLVSVLTKVVQQQEKKIQKLQEEISLLKAGR